MGTNYYLKTGNKITKTCDCGFEHELDEELHIGKSSYGWKFILHIIPERGINELEDWEELFKTGKIFDEYGNEITEEQMMDCILNRSFPEYDRYPDRGCGCDVRDNLLYVLEDPIGSKSISYVLSDRWFS
jgi:hypothetical protein